MPWTTDDLLSAVKRKVMAPSGGIQVTDSELLDIAWEETMKRIVPAVRAVREDYWTTTIDISLANGDTFKRVPSRASASTATSFWLLVTGDLKPRRLLPIEATARQRFEGTAASVPTMYALEGDKMYLYPPPGQSGLTLRVQYDRRPSRYVPVSSCGLVSAVDVLTGVITAPGGTFSATPTVDVVQADSPFDVLVQGAATTYAANSFTFGAGVLASTTGVAVGDYVALAGYTCVPPLPDVLHPALVDFTAAAYLGDTGYTGRRDVIREDIETYLPSVLQELAIRVSDDPPFAFNRESPLRSGGWPRFYGGRQ